MLFVILKPAAHVYLKPLGRGDFHYENHLSHEGLKRLALAFVVDNRTLKMLEGPQNEHAGDVFTLSSRKRWIALAGLRATHWLCPRYRWLPRKLGEKH